MRRLTLRLQNRFFTLAVFCLMTGPAFAQNSTMPHFPVPPIQNLHAVANDSGTATTYADNVTPTGFLDLTSDFFQDFGTNDRTCFACHAPRGGWSITPSLAQFLFEQTQGTDPCFGQSTEPLGREPTSVL